MKKKIAFISEHASPLATLGGVDAGGQNVYVAELAKALAKLGYHIDIYTRWESPDQPKVVDWLPRIRVIHVPVGPLEAVTKEKLLSYMAQFLDEMLGYIHRQHLTYELIHAHFFMSAWVAMRIKAVLALPTLLPSMRWAKYAGYTRALPMFFRKNVHRLKPKPPAAPTRLWPNVRKTARI